MKGVSGRNQPLSIKVNGRSRITVQVTGECLAYVVLRHRQSIDWRLSHAHNAISAVASSPLSRGVQTTGDDNATLFTVPKAVRFVLASPLPEYRSVVSCLRHQNAPLPALRRRH